MRELLQIRKDVESFSQQISKEFYLQGAGLKKSVDFDKIYSKYPGLFSIENLNKIKDSLTRNSGNLNEKRQLTFFVEAFYSEILGNYTKNLVSEYYKREASGKISIEPGKNISYRSSMVELLNEKSRPRRELLRKAADEYTDKMINPVLESIFLMEKNYVREMGFKNRVDMFKQLSGIDLYKLDSIMQNFLSETEEVYVKTLARRAKKKLGLKINELRKHDILFLMRAHQFDSYFPKNKMLGSISKFVKKMGIDIKASDNIVFDLGARTNKSPRAFCSPVKIPNEVYLVIYPRGGEDDYTTFLHELGHALHFANIDSGLEFEYKWYGDNSVTEGFAMSFDHLTMNECWTENVMGFNSKDNHDYFEHRMLNELMMLRRYSAKIHYEILLHESGNLEGKKELYSSILESATKIKYSPENYLTDVDPNFYCARYLRAWMFQANLQRNMTDKFDENWFEKNDSGNLLRDLWSVGQKYNAEEIMNNNKWEKLSVKPLNDNIMKYLSN